MTTTPLLDLKVRLRPLTTRTAETLPTTSVAGVEVKATREEYQGVSNSFLDTSALSTAKFDFGTVEADEFAKLKAEFGGKSQVTYQADRSYSAVDFLPPALQALAGKDLEVPERVKLPGSEALFNLPERENKPVDLTANCHGTAWEAVQAYQGQGELEIFLGDAIIMDGHLEDGRRFRSLGKLDAEHSKELAQQSLQPGDVVAFYNPNGFMMTNLLHTATYAGGGLFFEKPDTERQDMDAPYRLATAEMVMKPIEKFLEGPVEARMYRPEEMLPSPKAAFAAGNSEEIANWAKEQGRELGMPLLTQLEMGLGGGIRGEYLTSLVDVPVLLAADGRGAAAL